MSAGRGRSAGAQRPALCREAKEGRQFVNIPCAPHEDSPHSQRQGGLYVHVLPVPDGNAGREGQPQAATSRDKGLCGGLGLARVIQTDHLFESSGHAQGLEAGAAHRTRIVGEKGEAETLGEEGERRIEPGIRRQPLPGIEGFFAPADYAGHVDAKGQKMIGHAGGGEGGGAAREARRAQSFGGLRRAYPQKTRQALHLRAFLEAVVVEIFVEGAVHVEDQGGDVASLDAQQFHGLSAAP
ncbi:hypothetical protein SDC9_13489 [bioreactor metagenome]|uniref:Uncharacterized protein n=1 Tax=bioreactor metagenome TaxID=1076179 RepID=A0A644TLF5_9ZZZZ